MMNRCKAVPDYYRFYEQVNKNGLKYDLAIDNAVITQLTHKESITSGKLKQVTEQSKNRTLSPDTFYGHLNVLVDCKILNKIDDGRGKGVSYSLTESSKKLLKLNLLGVDWEKIKLFTRIYEKFFLYEVLHDPHLIVRSEQEFDALLSDLGVNREDMDWGRVSIAENYDSVELIYGNSSGRPVDEPLPKLSLPVRPSPGVKEYWKRRKGQTSISEKIEFTCFPLRLHNNLDVVIYRREYWKINKNSPSRIERTEYAVTIPGVSIGALVNDGGGNNTHSSFRGSKFDYAYVEKALDLLRQSGLIEPAIRFHGQMRYKIKDEDEHLPNNPGLRNFIPVLKAFYDSEFGVLEYKWKHFEGPTSEEKKRWTWLLGEREASRFFNEIEIIRYENRKGMRQCKNIEEYQRFLNTICPKEFSSQFWGPWPSSFILTDFKRKRQEEKKQQEKREQERRKKRGGRWLRTKKMVGTKKALKDDILKYEQYLKTKLETQLGQLPINLENEGIEEFRIMFSNILQKYPFLQGILKHICPRFFEHELTKEEIELAREYNEIEKEKADSLYGVYNPVTKKRERIVVEEIPDITKYLWPNRRRNKERK